MNFSWERGDMLPHNSWPEINGMKKELYDI